MSLIAVSRITSLILLTLVILSCWLGCQQAMPRRAPVTASQFNETDASTMCGNACKAWDFGCYLQSTELAAFACGPGGLSKCKEEHCPHPLSEAKSFSKACKDCFQKDERHMMACTPYYGASEKFCRVHSKNCRAYCFEILGGPSTDAADDWREFIKNSSEAYEVYESRPVEAIEDAGTGQVDSSNFDALNIDGSPYRERSLK